MVNVIDRERKRELEKEGVKEKEKKESQREKGTAHDVTRTIVAESLQAVRGQHAADDDA